MNAVRTLLALFLALVALGNAFMIDTAEYGEPAEYMPKRSFQHIWRNIQMQMPSSMQGNKRSESLSRARANAYYRLGK